MIFHKTSSFGNDFIEIDAGELPAGVDRGALVREICDRRRGVGADGVVLYWQGRKTNHWHFEIYNCDGGAAELSGNGMAGLAAVLFQRRIAPSPLVLRTAVGSRSVALVERRGALFRLEIEIGVPDFSAHGFFPFLSKGSDSYRCAGMEFHPVSVGNPHAVVLSRRLPSASRLAALGKKMENHPMFPRRVNVEFVQRTGAAAGAGGSACRVFFYERGVGPTQASSTGSAAVFAVLRRLGMAGDELRIDCGSEEPLRLSWQDGIRVHNLTRVVCRGEYRSPK